MKREEAIKLIDTHTVCFYNEIDSPTLQALHLAIEALSAESVQTVYCMDCAKSVPLDEHGALWYCKAHDRTMLRHSYCDNGERKGGEDEYF